MRAGMDAKPQRASSSHFGKHLLFAFLREMATEVRTTASLPPHTRRCSPSPPRRHPQKASKIEAKRLFHIITARTTQGEAMLAVGHAAYARKDWPAAMKAFQQSAEGRERGGRVWELSLMHAHGKTGVVDKEEARKWLKIAAEGGAVKAQMFLAQMSTLGAAATRRTSRWRSST